MYVIGRGRNFDFASGEDLSTMSLMEDLGSIRDGEYQATSLCSFIGVQHCGC